MFRTRLHRYATLTLVGFGCANPNPEPTMHEHPSKHGHHHGHGHDHGVNEHGYRGHRFDDPASWTKEFESAERTAWQQPDAVVASLGLLPESKIADIGAGTGYFAVRFAAVASAGKVYAVDIEPEMVAWLGTRASNEGLTNLVAVQGAANDPRLPEPVDVVFMCNVFHHLADASAYFEAVAGSLRPSGRVVIVDFRKDNPDDAPGPPAAMRMRPQEITSHMQAAGYTLAREDLELLEFQYVLEYVRG
jgi:cyclopropane fatty-acyl-phospholipid synthase-like methyltransferase